MSDSYLLRTVETLNASASVVPRMAQVAEDAARRLAGGGKLWVTGTPAMISELSSRAGGFMMIRRSEEIPSGSDDVVLHFPPENGTPSHIPPGGTALVVSFGAPGAAPDGAHFAPCAGAGAISPSVAAMMLGWMFAGEIIGALTRLGKMPVIYESIGVYNGWPRISQFKSGEIPFHEGLSVPPVEPGALALRYVEIVSAMLRRVEREERDKLDRAGAWGREARTRGGQLFMYSMGHGVPYEVSETQIGRVFRTGAWMAGFPRYPRPQDACRSGDFVAHIGYQHPPDDLLRKTRAAGARAVYVSVRADRDFSGDPDILWIDPMWDWGDACVPLEGYDAPLLPASGVVNAAIAWEICRLSR